MIARFFRFWLNRSRSSSAAAQLVALGGVALKTTANGVDALPPERARIAVHAEIPANTLLVAVSVQLELHAQDVGLALVLENGQVVDHALCRARKQPYQIALFSGPVQSALYIAIFYEHPTVAFNITIGDVVTFTGGLDPIALMPRPRLCPMPKWEDFYGGPLPDDLVGRLQTKAFGLLRAPASMQWLKQTRLWLEPGDEVSRMLVCTGTYEPETLMVVDDLLPEDGTFIDVGAHCGVYTVFAAACVGGNGRVLSFEPSEREFRRLQSNVALNQFQNVELFNVAVLDREREVILHVAEAGHAGHNTIADRFAYGTKLERAVRVPGTTLDSIADAQGFARCDMIKLDVEGAELSALRGAIGLIKRFRPVLIIEVFEPALANTQTNLADLLGWLSDLAYSLHDIDVDTGKLKSSARFPCPRSKNIVAVPLSHSARVGEQ